MKADGCRAWREQIGSFVLGHLDRDEQAALQAHLDACAPCSAEAKELLPVASLLDVADPQRPSPSAPAGLGERIFSAIDARGRAARARRRRRIALAASLALAGVGAFVAALALTGSPPTSSQESVAFHSLPAGVEIGAKLESRRWGTEIRLKVRGVRPGTVCTVWLRRHDGTRARAGSFRYLYEGGSDQVRLATALQRSEATGVGLRAGGKTFEASLPRVTRETE